MQHRKIISQDIGKIVYEDKKSGEVCHCFTDSYQCPITQKIFSIPGRGAIVHRISAFFFSRLQLLGVPTHFLRSLNMRESLVYSTTPLPFETIVHCGAVGEFAQRFSVPEGTLLERPILEHIHTESQLPINESHIFSFRWLDAEDLDDLQLLLSRTIDFLRGLFMGVGLHLLEARLLFGKFISSEGSGFFLAGDISPESFCVQDMETQEYFGQHYVLSSPMGAAAQYQKIATQLGLHLGKPGGMLPKVLPFILPDTLKRMQSSHD